MSQDDKSHPAPAPRSVDPISSLRTEMDRLFDNFSGATFPSFPSLFTPAKQGSAMLMPSVDVRENDKEIVVQAELPGIEEKDVSVTMHDGLLTIKGEKKLESEEEKDNYHRMERRYGSFHRSMRLPDTVDEDQISAKIDKGILTVTVAKKPGKETKERKIEIASK